MNKQNSLLTRLMALSLSGDEARVYIELLKGPSNHLQVARDTGINRTKVYRLVDDLEKRSLVSRQTDDRGTFLVASDPRTLEVEIVNQETKVQQRRAIYEQILPDLKQLAPQQATPNTGFAVQTYEGVEGFKQMLWHELKTKDDQDGHNELLVLGSGAIEDLVDSRQWAEKHRAMTVEAGYSIREILNPRQKPANFTNNSAFLTTYTERYLPEDILRLEHQIVIYNNVVATYHWRNEQKVGFEVSNLHYTNMMRQLFEAYWKLAGKITA